MEFKRNCPVCAREISYTRKYNYDQANKNKKKCYECTMKSKAGNQEDWFRHCPGCDEKITYTNKGNMQAANKVNKKCLKCSKNEKQTDTEFRKHCPECDSTIYYKNKVSLDESVQRNSKCKLCVSKETSKRQRQKGGNKGMMIEKYGEEEGIRRFEEAEEKRLKAFTTHWEENPEALEDLVNKRAMWKCKVYQINNIKCRGKAEKYYIEQQPINKLPKK